MKKIITIYSCFFCLLNINVFSQLFTPPNFVQTLNYPLNINNIVYSSLSNINNYAQTISLQNYTLTNIANFGYVSSNEIQLLPSFEASPNNQGSFFARIADAPFEVVLTNKQNMSFNTPDQFPLDIRKYKLVEFGVKLKPSIQNLIDNFVNDNNPPAGGGLNPYDKDIVSVEADFYQPSPSGFKKRYGFYIKDHQQSNPNTSSSALVPVSTLYPFRIRYCPPYTGTMYVKIRVYINGIQLTDDLNNPYEYISPTFNVTSDLVNQLTEKGPLELGTYNHLRYKENNEQFFAVGQNLVRGVDFNSYEEYIGSFSDMSDKGNFTRIRMDPDALGIEWEELGVYGSQRPNRLINNNPSNILPWHRQTQGFVLDKAIEAAADNQIYFMLCLEQDQNLNNNPYGDSSPTSYFHWNQNPYRTISGVSSVGSFLQFQAPWEYWKKRLHYIIARWGYSPYLAFYEVFNETDNIASNLGGQGYNNNYNFRGWTHQFIQNTKLFIKSYDNNNLVTTGFANCPALKNANSLLHAQPRIGDLDCYSCNKYQTDNKYTNWVRRELTNDVLIEFNSPRRPFIFGETGIFDCNPAPDKFTDIEYHNNAWATAMMGGMGSGLYWYDQNGVNKKDHLRGVKYFMKNIPFETNDFSGRYDDNKLLTAYNTLHFIIAGGPDYQWFYSVNQSGSKAFGWLHNYDTWYAADLNHDPNNIDSCSGWNYPSKDNSGTPFAFPEFKIKNMQLFKWYQIDFYKTYSSSTPFQQSTIKYAGILGLKVTYPGLLGVLPNGAIESLQADNNSSIQPDVAFRIKKTGDSFPYRTSNTNLYEQNFMDGENDLDSLVQHESLDLPNDTTMISDEPIKIDAVLDINHNSYLYFWDFGNGQTSTSSHPTVLYNIPGNYNAILTYTDTQNQVYTVKQTIVVKRNDKFSYQKNNGISVYPNPTQSELFLNNKFHDSIQSIDIYNSILQLIDSSKVNEGLIFDLRNYVNGIYFIKVTLSDNKTIIYFKVTKV